MCQRQGLKDCWSIPAGKGFAVVASEVKALATQTERSTEEITRSIGEVRSATAASVAAVGRIDQTIATLSTIAGSIAAAVEQQGAATAEIARNVTHTAEAVNAMTARITEVSGEAHESGQRTTAVRESAETLMTAVSNFRRSVVRVVRTSTEDVNRRKSPRFDVDVAARMELAGGRTQAVRVTNLSEGGARIGGASLAADARGALVLDGLAHRLPFIVHGMENQEARVAFTLDAAAGLALRTFLERWVPAVAA